MKTRCVRKCSATNVKIDWLCKKMFEIIGSAQPHVAIRCDVWDLVDELIQKCKVGKKLEPLDYEWSILFNDIDWENPHNRRAHRCGITLLHFLWSLGSKLAEFKVTSMSCEKLLELLIAYQKPDELYLVFDGPERNWVICSTPLGDRKFGKHIEIAFDGKGPIDGWRFTTHPLEGTDLWESCGGC